MQTHANMAFPDEICQQSVLIIKIPLHRPHFNPFKNIAMFKNENFLFVYKNVY